MTVPPSKSLHLAEKITRTGTVHFVPLRFIPAALRVGLAFAILAAGAANWVTGQEVLPREITDIPDNLFQVQDEAGFFWQLTGNGALTSGETQYLQSGMNLLIDNEVFTPSVAQVQAPGNGDGDGVAKIDVVFSETRKGLTITRDVWIDTKRSGVRFFDSVENTGAEPVEVTLVLRTTYPFGWQSLHDDEGSLLSSDPVLRLDPDDRGLTVHFSPAEGRHDTVFLTGLDEQSQKPELGASTNSRELTFRYTLSLKSGETASVYHWLMQRNLSSPDSAAEVFSSFTQRNQLINPGVSSLKAVSVVNFPRVAFPDERVAPSRLRELLALNELMDQIGWHRRRDDAHWVGQTNQISGVVNRDGSLTITGKEFGERVVSLDQVAAIRGFAGGASKPFLYLRNGEVLTGNLADAKVKWKVGESETPLGMDEIQLLLLGTEVADGAPPAEATHFVKFKSGVILAVDGKGSDPLHFNTPWGAGEIVLTDLAGLGYSSNPSPGYVLRTKEGSFFSAFLSKESRSFKGVDGKAIEFPMVSLDAIWRAGATGLDPFPQSDQWLEFAEIPETLARSGGFLLSGNTVLAGRFLEEVIAFRDGGASLSIATANIVSIKRLAKTAESDQLKFEILLKSGDRVEGAPSAPIFGIDYSEREIEVPIAYLQAYRAATTEGGAK